MAAPRSIAKAAGLASFLLLAGAGAWLAARELRSGAPAAAPAERARPAAPAVERSAAPSPSAPAAAGEGVEQAQDSRRAARAEVHSAADDTLFEIRVSCGDDGSPVEGAWIDVGWLAVTTGSDGVARVLRGDDKDFLAQWRRGELKLDVAAKGFVREQFAVPPEASVVEIEVWRAVMLSGVVVDAATGRPVPHASVVILDAFGGAGRRGRYAYAHGVDAGGRMEPVRVPRGVPVTVEVEAKGYAVTHFEHALDADFDAVWPLGEGGIVRGVVREPAGAPIEGARIEVVSERGCGSPHSGSRTDALGRFELRGLEIPCAYYVEARRVTTWRDGINYPATGRSEPFELTVEEPERTVELTVAILLDRIDVEVVDGSGAPLALAQVHCAPAPGRSARMRVPNPLRPFLHDATDGTGRCALYTGEVGAFEVRASKERHASARAIVEVAAGAPARVRLVLDRGRSLGRRVVAADGRPAGGVELTATTGGNDEAADRASTDVNGRFLFASLPDAPATIAVVDWRRAPREPCFVRQEFGPFEARRDDVRLQLAEPAVITGRIVPRPDDRNVPCEVTTPDGWSRAEGFETDLDGRFAVQLAGFAAPVSLLLNIDDRPPVALGPFSTTPGARFDVGEIVQPPGVITGVVIACDGAQAKGAWISFGQGDWRSEEGVEADERGAFRLEGVPSGPGWIEAWADGCGETTIEVADLAHCSPIEIRLSRVLRVTGKVRATTRPIVGRVQVWVSTPESDDLWRPVELARSDDGSFAFELRRGRYKLFAELFGIDGPVEGPEFEIIDEDVTIDWDL